jgi:hypothetical protein
MLQELSAAAVTAGNNWLPPAAVASQALQLRAPNEQFGWRLLITHVCPCMCLLI